MEISLKSKSNVSKSVADYSALIDFHYMYVQWQFPPPPDLPDQIVKKIMFL